VFIDGYAWGNSTMGCVGDKGAVAATQGYAWLPLFGATLFFVGLNGMKWSELRDDGISDPKAAAKAKIFLLFLLLIAVGCIAGSAALMADKCVWWRGRRVRAPVEGTPGASSRSSVSLFVAHIAPPSPPPPPSPPRPQVPVQLQPVLVERHLVPAGHAARAARVLCHARGHAAALGRVLRRPPQPTLHPPPACFFFMHSAACLLLHPPTQPRACE
jgi:hypothetical protein